MRLKPAIIRTSQRHVYNLLELKQVVNIDMKVLINNILQRQIYLLINKNCIKIFIKILRKI